MKVALISPVRIASEDWAKFSNHVILTFNSGQRPKALGDEWVFGLGTDYKYHPITDAKHPVTDDTTIETLEDGLTSAFRRVRRNIFASRTITDDVVAVIFDTGEACVIELCEFSGEIEDCLLQLESARVATARHVTVAGKFLQPLFEAGNAMYVSGETTTHTVLLCDGGLDVDQEIAQHCFQAEGLTFEPGDFVPGWSFSVCMSQHPTAIWDCVALMVRLQCEWYTMRVIRDFCLRAFKEASDGRSIRKLIDHEREIVTYQTELRLWRHRMQEFRANLKPALTDNAKLLEAKWEVISEKDFANDSLAQARNLIQTSYSRKLLLQERRQSLMLFVLTAFGVLSLASMATGYWEWLTLAKLFDDSQIASQMGQTIVKWSLWTSGALFIMLCVTVAVIRSGRD